MHLRRFLLALAAAAAGLLTVVALPAAPASAHASLVRTSPVQGSVVQEAPGQIVITFSETVTPVKEKIQVVGPDGKRADKDGVTENGDQLTIPMRTDVPRGTYLVSYRVISADSHPVGAAFTYSVGETSKTAPVPTGTTDSSRTDPVVDTGIKVLDYLGFAGLILIVGPALVLTALWPKRLSRRGPARVAYAGMGLLAVTTVLAVYLEAPYADGNSLFAVTFDDLREVILSRYGTAHLVRLGALVLLPGFLPRALRGEANRFDKAVLLLLGVVGVVTWGIEGHPSTSAAPTLTVVADAAHLSAVAIWLGGLVMLFAFLLRQANARELRAILPVWSNWATLAVTVLVLAGVAQALIEIGTVGALLHTWYGQLVMLKVGMLAVVLGVAAVSRSLVQRRAVVPEPAPVLVGAGGGAPPDDPDDAEPDDAEPDDAEPDDAEPDEEPQIAPRALGRLRRAVLIEVLGAMIILGLTAVLVQAPPARVATAAGSADTGGPNGIFSTTLTSKLYQLQLDIEPVQTGPNDIHMYAYTPDGAPTKVYQWTVTAALPAQNVEPIAAAVTPIVDDHAIGQITLPTVGQWQFSFTLRTSDFDEATVTAVIKITK